MWFPSGFHFRKLSTCGFQTWETSRKPHNWFSGILQTGITGSFIKVKTVIIPTAIMLLVTTHQCQIRKLHSYNFIQIAKHWLTMFARHGHSISFKLIHIKMCRFNPNCNTCYLFLTIVMKRHVNNSF